MKKTKLSNSQIDSVLDIQRAVDGLGGREGKVQLPEIDLGIVLSR